MTKRTIDEQAESPFKAGKYGDIQTYHLTAEDRIHATKDFDRGQCHAALKVPGLQKTVDQAIRRRLRILESQSCST